MVTTEARIAACDNHGIQKDGEFVVLCRDKDGIFTGCKGDDPHLCGQANYNLADAVAIAKHMAKLGYRFTKQPPTLLLPSEMSIYRMPNGVTVAEFGIKNL